jgi:hypothetical protein
MKKITKPICVANAGFDDIKKEMTLPRVSKSVRHQIEKVRLSRLKRPAG